MWSLKTLFFSSKIELGSGWPPLVWWITTLFTRFFLWNLPLQRSRYHSASCIFRYTSLCDVWSFGVLAWEIFSKGGTPYQGMTNTRARELIDSGYRMPAPDGTPDEVYQLMLRYSLWGWHSLFDIFVNMFKVLAIRPRRPSSFCWNPCNCWSSLFPVSFCVAW